jgi:hypothetical protein
LRCHNALSGAGLSKLHVDAVKAFAEQLVRVAATKTGGWSVPTRFGAQCLAFNFELEDPTSQVVKFEGDCLGLGAEARRRLVDEIDGFVWEKPIRKVAVRHRRGGNKGGVANADPMVGFEAFTQTAQDADGLIHGRFPNDDWLKPPFESCVPFDVLTVLRDCRGADAVQFAPCE